MDIKDIMGKMGTGDGSGSGSGIGDMGSGLGMGGNKCDHNWKIFNDTELKGSGEMSFYCTKCLAMQKKKTEYPKKE